MRNKSGRTQLGLPYILIVLLVLPPGAGAQTSAPAPQTPAAAPQTPPAIQPFTVRDLKVVPLAGNHEMNDLERRVMSPLVVQVLDQNDRPVDGADVVFRFPLDGPSASFPDRKNAQTFRTNADGQAAAIGWTANGTLGTFQVQVTATRLNEQGSTAISMTNVSRIVDDGRGRPKRWWSSKWTKIAIIAIAAGVTVGVVLATRGASSSSSAPTVVVGAPGSPTIGGPQ